MISFLEGTIEYLGDKYVILNAGGIGYKITVVPKLINILSKSTSTVKRVGVNVDPEQDRRVKLHIHSQLNMREGTFDMYGFDKREDLELFHLLTSVSGIGPKGALNILSTVEPKHLKAAIINEDSNYLKKVSGLGPKTAQRLVLELKNKVDYLNTNDTKGLDLNQESQATEALLALGYSPSQAKEALKETTTERLEDRIREALKFLGKK